MPDVVYATGAKAVLDQTINWVSATAIKVMLVGTGYTPVYTHQFVTASGAGAAELTVSSGYVKGYGGSGRKALATKAISIATKDIKFTADNLVAGSTGWTALPAGDTIAGAIVIYETGGTDATAVMIVYKDLTDTATNGSDVGITWHSDGVLKFTVP